MRTPPSARLLPRRPSSALTQPAWEEEEATEIEIDLSGALAALLERLPPRRHVSSRAQLRASRFEALEGPTAVGLGPAVRERTQSADLLVVAEEHLRGLSAVEIEISYGGEGAEDLEELDPSLLVEL